MKNQMISVKEFLKRKYKGLKDYFLDRMKGYDTAPRFYKKYGAKLGLDPQELLMRALEDIEEKKEHLWHTHRIFDRRQGATMAIAFIGYYLAAIRKKDVLIIVKDENARKFMTKSVLKFPIFDKEGKTFSNRLRLMTVSDVNAMKLRGSKTDVCLIDRVGKEKVWFEAMDKIKEDMLSSRVKRVIEFNQSLAQ